MEEVGVFIVDGKHLFRVVDRWLGFQSSKPQILLEDCDAQTFKWFDADKVVAFQRIYPDANE